jgi:hypothetical protein
LEISSKEKIRIYFSGGVVAFSISFILIELLSIILGVSPSDQGFLVSFRVLIIGIHVLGGLIGGFLAARISPISNLQTGAMTGVSAFVIQQIVYFIYGVNAIPRDLLLSAALVFGSIMGSFCYGVYAQKRFSMKVDTIENRNDETEE